MRNKALDYTLYKMRQYLVDNPDIKKGSLLYRKEYIKVYNEYKRKFEPYDKPIFEPIEITEELYIKVRKFIHHIRLKEKQVTLIDLLKIVDHWCLIEPDYTLYNTLPTNKQLDCMWKDLFKFYKKYRKVYEKD